MSVSRCEIKRAVLTAGEVCEMIGISRQTLRRLVAVGKLRPIKAFGWLKFTRRDIEDFINAKA